MAQCRVENRGPEDDLEAARQWFGKHGELVDDGIWRFDLGRLSGVGQRAGSCSRFRFDHTVNGIELNATRRYSGNLKEAFHRACLSTTTEGRDWHALLVRIPRSMD